MKLLSVILLAILNFCLIKAVPTKEQNNGDFAFWITGVKSGEADIVGLGPNNKNAKSITIPSYFIVEGDKYYVRSINYSAFSNASFNSVVFQRSSKVINLEYNSFAYCKNLKKVTFNSTVNIKYSAFNGCNDVEFDGRGVPSIVKALSKDLLKSWNLPVDYEDYHDKTWNNKQKMKTDLYNLAKKIHDNMGRNSGKNGSNVGSILLFYNANERGMHMLFRQLAITMGVSSKYILNGGDGHCTYWNYVKEDHDKYYDQWNNVEIFKYDYSKYTGNTYPSDFYKTNNQLSKFLIEKKGNSEIHKQPYNWVVYLAQYGTQYENLKSSKMLVDEYIKVYNLGGMRA